MMLIIITPKSHIIVDPHLALLLVAVLLWMFLSFSEFYQQLCLFKQQISKVEGSDHSVTSIKDEKNISDMFVHSNFCQSI